MEKVFGYIFSSLKLNDEMIYEIDRELRHQHKINRRFVVFSLATAAYIYINDKRYKEEKEKLEKKLDYQSRMIDKLNNDILALNNVKGEQQM